MNRDDAWEDWPPSPWLKKLPAAKGTDLAKPDAGGEGVPVGADTVSASVSGSAGVSPAPRSDAAPQPSTNVHTPLASNDGRVRGEDARAPSNEQVPAVGADIAPPSGAEPGAPDAAVQELAATLAEAARTAVTTFFARLDRLEQLLSSEREGRDDKRTALAEALAALEKQIGRAGREQFKATTLAEAQRDQLQEVLEGLHAAEAEREQEVAALRESAGATAKQARMAIARAILPALDGLDEALRSGRGIALAGEPSPEAPRRPWFRRGERPVAASPAGSTALRSDLRAWLAGIEFVRQRLLDVLAAEGISPIAAEGQPFDPEIHLAVEASKAANCPPNTVAAVVRQGYRHEQGVLRPADVVVARADEAQ